VVTNEAVPDPVRQGLSAESGLNDGICVPILFVFLALATGKTGDESPWQLALMLVAEEIGIGLAVGLILTAVAALLLKFARKQDWLTHTWIQVPVVALALSCFGVAQLLGGSGFIAAFSGGLLFGILAKQVRQEYLRAAEGTGDTMALITWVIFGAAVVGQALGHFSWRIWVYAILSLTLIRMLPVFLCLTGMGVSAEGKLFMGWFGPRGLASIVFAVIVVEAGVPNSGTIAATAACTIMLSIIAHGITANPWARGFGERFAKRSGGSHPGD
jgi:NhaP-type Na+/H+ or K+/H+ antiporter